MIIDYSKDGERAQLYSVYDAVTGERLAGTGLLIVWADDETGVYRHIPSDENGKVLVRETGNSCPFTTEEVNHPNGLRIKLRPEFETEEEGLAWQRVEKRLAAIHLATIPLDRTKPGTPNASGRIPVKPSNEPSLRKFC